MANHTLDKIQRCDIIELTWFGVTHKLESLFSKASGICSRDIQVIPAADPDDFEYLQQQKGGPLELPVIIVSPTQVEPDWGSYNTSVMRRVGYALKISEDRSNWTVARLAPVMLTFSVSLVTDDVVTLLRMIGRWTANEVWGFDLKQASWAAQIQVLADKSMAVPPRQTTSGGGRQFRLATTLRCKTYSGYLWYIPAIRTIELTTLFPTQGSIAEALVEGVLDETIVNVRSISENPPLSPVIFKPED